MKELDNLVKINQIKTERADSKEFGGMLRAAANKLNDLKIQGLSEDSQFAIAYGAAHAVSVDLLVSVGAKRFRDYSFGGQILVSSGIESNTN